MVQSKLEWVACPTVFKEHLENSWNSCVCVRSKLITNRYFYIISPTHLTKLVLVNKGLRRVEARSIEQYIGNVFFNVSHMVLCDATKVFIISFQVSETHSPVSKVCMFLSRIVSFKNWNNWTNVMEYRYSTFPRTSAYTREADEIRICALFSWFSILNTHSCSEHHSYSMWILSSLPVRWICDFT